MRKNTKQRLRIPLVAVLAILFASVGVLFWRALSYDVPMAEGERASVPPPVAEPVVNAVGIPIRIRIPSIGVDAAVENVGLTTEGLMAVPTDPMNVGWYGVGPRPGEVGSAVMDGHVDWYHGARAIFENLSGLKPGDAIEIEGDSGSTVLFTVRETRTYDSDADASDIFVSGDGKAHLNLITCDGVWNRVEGQYTKRLVVFADQDI